MRRVLFTPRFLSLLVGLSLISVIMLCLGSFSAIAGATVDCPMMHVTALCPMAVAERLQYWKDIFVPPSLTLILLALLALGLRVSKFGVGQFASDTFPPPPRQWLRLFAPITTLFDPLKRQLSQGILHPKIF